MRRKRLQLPPRTNLVKAWHWRRPTLWKKSLPPLSCNCRSLTLWSYLSQKSRQRTRWSSGEKTWSRSIGQSLSLSGSWRSTSSSSTSRRKTQKLASIYSSSCRRPDLRRARAGRKSNGRSNSSRTMSSASWWTGWASRKTSLSAAWNLCSTKLWQSSSSALESPNTTSDNSSPLQASKRRRRPATTTCLMSSTTLTGALDTKRMIVIQDKMISFYLGISTLRTTRGLAPTNFPTTWI